MARAMTWVSGLILALSDAVMKRADDKLSFSKMTFPHQLMRLILVEQIYRAFRINRDFAFSISCQLIYCIGQFFGCFHFSFDGKSDDVDKLSFSKMTFPHQLMRLILVEQIYRAFRINRGEPPMTKVILLFP
jgi:23S rRNA pseudoU1915 N3-methylase RlmH